MQYSTSPNPVGSVALWPLDDVATFAGIDTGIGLARVQDQVNFPGRCSASSNPLSALELEGPKVSYEWEVEVQIMAID